MDSKCKSNGDMCRMQYTIEIQKTMIDGLLSQMNDMKVNMEIEKVTTARKMADLSGQNQAITEKLKTLEAESSSIKVQILQFEELRNKVDELMAEKNAYDRLKKEMTDLMKDLRTAVEHRDDRPVQTSVAPDHADGLFSAWEEHRQCEELTDVNCDVQSPDPCVEEAFVALPVEPKATAPATSTVEAFPSASGMTARVSEGPGTSECAVLLQVKQPTAEPLAEMPVKSELQEASNRPDDAPAEARLSSTNDGPMMTEDATPSDVAFNRLLSSTNPRIRELKKMNMDAIKGPGMQFRIDFLDRIAIEEGLELCYQTYAPKSGRDADDYSYVQLSIDPIDTVTLGFGESVVEAQADTAFNCLLFFKHNML